MKSVTLVALSGSWFCSSLTSSVRKSLELSVVRDVSLDDEVDEVVAVDELAAETFMAETPALAANIGGTQHDHAVVKAFADQTAGAPNPGAQLVGRIS
ncbi:hypothetical protein S58_28020 [Bradyrhizobium oligotrophicum S58]|uniref:Uncharacterized protein n=1 Tax=Bradyrhizobium oligotrophicum S58 TaxID=1245469 RepID=M4Z5N7_9BRAD|nr:hypothetical protein S58_28020 [Bradyrhizobium oligotrophicum S58]